MKSQYRRYKAMEKKEKNFDQTIYKNNYNKENYDRTTLMLPKGGKEKLKKKAASQGMSVNEYVINLINTYEDGSTDADERNERKHEGINIGENIKKARKEAGFTQKELADRLGVYQKDVSRWENGNRKVEAEALASICRALGVSADKLLELTGDETAGE
jgi:DNA-binding transcriptional regulator YiaG